MKIRSNYDFYSVEECEQDAKEMVNLLKMERTCSTMKERLSRLNFEVYDTDCGYIAGSKVEHEGLGYVDYMLLSGHAFKRACERGIDAAKLTKLAIAVANNFDAYAEIHNHRIMPVRNRNLFDMKANSLRIIEKYLAENAYGDAVRKYLHGLVKAIFNVPDVGKQ